MNDQTEDLIAYQFLICQFRQADVLCPLIQILGGMEEHIASQINPMDLDFSKMDSIRLDCWNGLSPQKAVCRQQIQRCV